MEFRDIEYVSAVAKYESVSKASQELFITQPSLSIYIKNLERRMGVELFQRVGKRFVLTWTGEQFLQDGREIILLKKCLEAKMNSITSSNHGRLRLGLPILRGISFLPSVLPKFQKMYPRVSVEIFEDDAASLDRQINNAEIDIGIFNQPLNDERMDYQLISKEEIVLCANANDALLSSSIERSGFRFPWIDIQKCKDRTFILNYPGQRNAEIAQHIFLSNDFYPEKVMRIHNLMTAVSLAAKGVGLAFSNEKYATQFYIGEKSAVLSVGREPTFMNLVAGYRKGANLPSYIQDFIDLAKANY